MCFYKVFLFCLPESGVAAGGGAGSQHHLVLCSEEVLPLHGPVTLTPPPAGSQPMRSLWHSNAGGCPAKTNWEKKQSSEFIKFWIKTIRSFKSKISTSSPFRCLISDVISDSFTLSHGSASLHHRSDNDPSLLSQLHVNQGRSSSGPEGDCDPPETVWQLAKTSAVKLQQQQLASVS